MKTNIILVFLTIIHFLASCKNENVLQNKVICIDPGHGGTAATDSFRIGPGGEREEWINLRVALHLEKMLQENGANVVMTRIEDVSIGLKERALMAVESKADIFVSIHHNATADSAVNFPIIYFHGNASENQAGVQFGKLIAQHISKKLYDSEIPSSVVSDHVIFPGTGTAVLRHSYGIPGIIGEASFFSNPNEEQRLKDKAHNKKEALAYFNAIKEFFKHDSLPILEKNSKAIIAPFPVLQEAERMSQIAKLWKQDFDQGKKLFETDDPDSVKKALGLFTRSARSFPDSWLAGEAHYYRSLIFEKNGKNNNAYMERRRIKEHYPLQDLN